MTCVTGHCPRCGELHEGLEIKTLNSVDPNPFDEWTTCPATGQPIFIRTIQRGAPLAAYEQRGELFEEAQP